MMVLYTHHSSSAAHRVRIALNIKGLPYESRFVELKQGQHKDPVYMSLNPQGTVPCLVDGGVVITQSLAIVGYLNDKYVDRPLLPEDVVERARVRELAHIICTEQQPLNSYRVFEYFRDVFKVDYEARRQWFEHWTHRTFAALEYMMSDHPMTGACCHGNTPTLADVYLVPQVHSAMVHDGVDMANYPTLRSIYRHCMTLAAFQAAAPETQADAVI